MVLMLLATLLVGCGSGSDGADGTDGIDGADGTDGTDGADGEPAGPVIANISTVGSPIYPGGQVQVYVSASSPSGASLSYSWEIPKGWGGSDSGDELVVITAPDEQAAQGRVSVAVSDGERSRSAYVEVATRGPEIEAWSADLSAAEPLAAEDTIDFAADAYNRDGSVMRYHHDIGGLRFEDRDAAWSWTVSQRSMGGIYRLQTIVEDGSGLTVSAGKDVTLEGVSPWPGLGGDRQRSGRSRSTTAADGGDWTFSTRDVVTGDVIESSPALGADGTIYIGSDNNLYALNPDGSFKWTYSTGPVKSSPVLAADGTVYVGSTNNTLYALNTGGGMEWSYDTGDPVQSSPVVGADGTVYVAAGRTVYALYPVWGVGVELKWEYKTGATIHSSPVVGADGSVYVGADRNLYALNPVDGSLKWSRQLTDDLSFLKGSPALGADGTIYMPAPERLYALEPADGAVKWTYAIHTSTLNKSTVAPTVGPDGTIYVGSIDNKVDAINPDGSLKWSFATGGSVNTSPALSATGNTLYVGSVDGKLYALDTADGNTRFVSYDAGSPIYSSPAVGADGTVYVGSVDGTVHAVNTWLLLIVY